MPYYSPYYNEPARPSRRSLEENGRIVMKYVSSIEEGRQLLDLAEKLHCPIRYDPSLPYQEHDGQGGVVTMYGATMWQTDGYGRRGRPEIVINPNAPVEMQIVTLGHELRHLWQDHVLGGFPNPGELSPLLAMTFQRVVEGDAHTFQNFFAKKISRVTGANIPYQDFPNWTVAFDAFQRSQNALTYDEKSLNETAAAVDMYNRGGLRTIFNVGASDKLANLQKILRMGMGEKAKPYTNFKNNSELVKYVFSHIQPEYANYARNLGRQASLAA